MNMSAKLHEYEEEEGSNDNGDNTIGVQLGFSVPIDDADVKVSHESPCWIDWDGGHMGGRPSWLQPRDLPCVKLCETCQKPLHFICQLYAPADSVNPSAFHRSLYVFACHDTVQVLRTQLPQENEFFPLECNEAEADALERDWTRHLPQYWNVNLCKVCGQLAKGKCPTQGVSFCSKHHQVLHKKHVYDNSDGESENDAFFSCVLAKSQLVVEEEPDENEESDRKKAGSSNTPLFESHSGDSDKKDLDQDLEQADLNEMTGALGCRDPTTLEFYARMSRPNNAQEQCLRYSQWPSSSNDDCGPLWISSTDQPPTDNDSIPPPCPYCGATRKFEFQLQPQMIHHLLKNQQHQNNSDNDDKTKQAVLAASAIAEGQDVPREFAETLEQSKQKLYQQIFQSSKGGDCVDWGVIAVYTCTASCDIENVNGELGAYREEYAWRQGPLE